MAIAVVMPSLAASPEFFRVPGHWAELKMQGLSETPTSQVQTAVQLAEQ